MIQIISTKLIWYRKLINNINEIMKKTIFAGHRLDLNDDNFSVRIFVIIKNVQMLIETEI